MSELDCGDNSCQFATKRGGMRTNGGCRCFDNAGYGRSATGAAFKLLPEVIGLRAKLKIATKALKKIASYDKKPQLHAQNAAECSVCVAGHALLEMETPGGQSHERG